MLTQSKLELCAPLFIIGIYAQADPQFFTNSNNSSMTRKLYIRKICSLKMFHWPKGPVKVILANLNRIFGMYIFYFALHSKHKPFV